MATTYCYLLIESRKQGCLLVIHYAGVTLNQTEAYEWQQQAKDFEFIRREAKQVVFLS